MFKCTRAWQHKVLISEEGGPMEDLKSVICSDQSYKYNYNQKFTSSSRE